MNLNVEKKQIDLISESILVFKTCNLCHRLPQAGPAFLCDDRRFRRRQGKSCLFRLKQMCHELFRNSPEASYKEKFYDITVGYIFHEAMKPRECIYQLEYYKPEYHLLVNSPELHYRGKESHPRLRHTHRQGREEARRRAQGGKDPPQELVANVKELIKMYRDNYLLPRFILENEKSLITIYGKKGYHDLITSIYDHGRSGLMFKAALSYLESEYYQTAKALFQKVVRADGRTWLPHFSTFTPPPTTAISKTGSLWPTSSLKRPSGCR